MKRLFLVFTLTVAVCVTAAEPEMSLIYEEDPTLLVTTVQIAFLSGSADDPKGKAGVTNIATELMLRGTKKRTRSAFQSELERMGASLGVYTSHDHVTFIGQVIKENTLPFLKLVQDALLSPRFAAGEFSALKTEQLHEIAHWKNNNNFLGKLVMRKMLFEGTPLEYTAAGSLATVKSIKIKDVVTAYNRIVTKGNAVFGIASPLKKADVHTALQPVWKGLLKGERTKRESIAPKVPTKPQLIVVNKPKTSTGSVVFGQAGITVKDKYRYTLGVANYSFGAEPLVSRLFRIVRGELGWTYAINSSYGSLGPLTDQQGIYTIAATPSVEFTTKTIHKVLSLWDSYLKSGLEKSELSLAHESMVNSYPFEFDSAEKRLGENMYSYMYGVPVLSPEQYKQKIEGISRDEIKAGLKERQTPGGWLIALVADADEIGKQLAAEQKDVPADQRLTITKSLTPDEIIR